MMNTPILDFVTEYERKNMLRLHMPGHKGQNARDITEIEGADSLYEAAGIIAESEQNATALFGHPTFYSTEGSSQCIRAMVYLAKLQAAETGKEFVLLAGRSAHKTFCSAAALMDARVEWLYGEQSGYLVGDLAGLEAALERHRPVAVYLTTPDYLGGELDVAAAASLCRQHDALLLVDSAHGAYLKFLSPSRLALDLGADMCCTSAHKTLPVLTGGAYLHVSPAFAAGAKKALAMFGSTSPSYLILQSLDAANAYLADGYKQKLAAFAEQMEQTKERLHRHGYETWGNEPLKLTILTKPYGYRGQDFARQLHGMGVEVEFADPDYVVMMFTPEQSTALAQVEELLRTIPPAQAITERAPVITQGERVMSLRQSMFSPWEYVPACESVGRVLANPDVGCPPAVPIAMCGERIDAAAAAAFTYYGITQVCVVK